MLATPITISNAIDEILKKSECLQYSILNPNLNNKHTHSLTNYWLMQAFRLSMKDKYRKLETGEEIFIFGKGITQKKRESGQYDMNSRRIKVEESKSVGNNCLKCIFSCESKINSEKMKLIFKHF
nr:uncharacterized protein LOC124816926 isoform X2 [Hydra vulgaris]